jgi:glycosyltransferase involved in cell wall biosynthesis
VYHVRVRIAFVMPAYNEEALIGRSIDGCLALVERLVIVDDGSTDDTGRIVDEYARRHPQKIEVIHQRNRGIGGAVLAGLRRLLDRDDVDAIGIIASDDQCDPALIPQFRRVLESRVDIDVAKGSRFLHAETLHRMPPFRYWGNRFVSLAMQIILGYHGMSDLLHGYLVARLSVFRTMKLDRIAEGYDLENTMMAELRRLRCRVALLPSPSRYGEERSTIVYRTQIPKTLGTMARLLATRLTSGPLIDRLAPALLVGGNLPAAWLAMRLTSPRVERFAFVDQGNLPNTSTTPGAATSSRRQAAK